MDELRLVGVHDDGEHLVLEDPSGARHLLRIDQQLRGTVQRARRVAPRRQGSASGDFGPRDIQARFRAGSTVEEIVEESGWEPERVRRYEWPILAERAHIAREAQKVEVVARTSRSGGYRSVFDGEAQSLAQIVRTHSAELGISPTSLDWDAWQRPDQQWQISARFRLANPGAAPRDVVDQQPAALWIFNPASLTVTPDNGWAGHLTATPGNDAAVVGSDSLFGIGTSASAERPTERPAESSDLARDTASPTDGATHAEASRGSDAPIEATDEAATDGPGELEQSDEPGPQATSETAGFHNTDELLDVLEARRGQRIGDDADSDDHLAEILGRGMGHVERRPRPISAPQDSTLFDRTVHPTQTESAAEDDTTEVNDPDTPTRANDSTVTDDSTDTDESDDRQERPEATIHHLGRADVQDPPTSPVVEITDDSSVPLDDREASTPVASSAPSATRASDEAAGSNVRSGAAQEAGEVQDGEEAATEPDAGPKTPPAEETPAQRGPSSSPHTNGHPAGTGNGSEATVTPLRGGRRSDRPATPDPVTPDPVEATPGDHGDSVASTQDGRTGRDAAAGQAERESAEPSAPEAPERPARPRPRGKTVAKRSRSSVPSWDEIVFGAKNDDN